MVEYSEEQLNLIFKALADPTRRAMLARLSREELMVTELARPYEMSLAAVSKHLKVLEAADFVERTKDGRMYRCKANLEPLNGVTAVLEDLGAHWRAQLDSLEAFFKDNKDKKEQKHASNRKK